MQGIEKGPTGPKYLKLGDTKDLNQMSLNRSFKIYNRGPLNGFFAITIKSKENQHIFQSCNISITPRKAIIKAGNYLQIYIGFRPKRCDIKKFLRNPSEVISVAVLEIIYGDDPNRQRLAKIMEQKKYEDPMMYNGLEHLLNNYSNEMPIDFQSIKETPVRNY